MVPFSELLQLHFHNYKHLHKNYLHSIALQNCKISPCTTTTRLSDTNRSTKFSLQAHHDRKFHSSDSSVFLL
uniref:Uncharacterized protein n=1 Tax=Setaria viridis TaxID=4556 RepID=A0A4U6TYA1_SETVI|nr:hypothetical protein SEVIR_7G340456v2 [Setaria viridis]